MNSRVSPGRIIAAAVLLGSMFCAEAARAAPDASLAQVFEAVCLKPADSKGRKAAAYDQGLRTPPALFRGERLGRKGSTPELNAWKALEGRMLMVNILIEPFPGTKDMPALTCQVMLTPGDPGSLADAGATLGLPLSFEGATPDSVAFEDGPEGRKVIDMKDEAAADAALQAGRLRVVTIGRSNSKGDADMMILLRPLEP